MDAITPPRRLRLASPGTASLLGVLVVVLAAAGPPLTSLVHQSLLGNLTALPLVLAFGVVGIVVARQQPRHPMGWIMLGIAIGFLLNTDASDYSILDYRLHHERLPLGWLAVLLQPAWAPAILLCGLAVLLFPDGRLPANRLRFVAWAVLAVGAVWMIGAYAIAANALVEHTVHVETSGNLTATDHPNGVAVLWWWTQDAFFPLLFGSWIVVIVWQVRCYRRSTGERRLQLKWLLSGLVIFAVSLPALFASGTPSSTAGKIVSGLATIGLAALPISIGAGILRFRLYEIDRLISRTIAYAVVTGLLLGVYLAIVTLATRVLPFSSPVAVAASTLAAAALFNPLRRRTQHVVDRRFNRARYDAEATIAAFSASLRDAVELGVVESLLVEATSRSLEPAHASLWIRPPPA